MREVVKWSQNKQQQHGSHYRAQKDEHEIENSEFIQAKGVKNHAFKKTIFHDFEKSINNIQNEPTTKEKMSLESAITEFTLLKAIIFKITLRKRTLR